MSVALLFPLKKTKRRYLTAVIAIYILVFTALSGIKDYRQSSMEEKAEEKVAGTIVEKNDTFHLAGFLTDKDANSRYHSTEPSIYFFYTEKASPSIGEKLTITIKGASWQENGRTMVKVISMQQ